MGERSAVGKITHYYGHLGVAVVSLSGELKVGDEIEIEGGGEKLAQKVSSMQINHKNVDACKSGDDVGLKVERKVPEGAKVYKIAIAIGN